MGVFKAIENLDFTSANKGAIASLLMENYDVSSI